MTRGGWCRSVEDMGFIFDYAGHIMFSNDPYVHLMYDRPTRGNVHWQTGRLGSIAMTSTPIPIQGALFGLPPAVLRDCLVGAIEARLWAVERVTSAQW